MKKIVEPKTARRTLETCFVCNSKITGEPVRLPADSKNPDGYFRHKRCEPGGARWLNSDRAFASELTPYFAGTEE